MQHWVHALECFSQIHHRRLEPTVVTFGSLFAALGNGHKWVQVLELLQSALDVPSNTRILTNVTLGVLKKAHRWDLALELCVRGDAGKIPSLIAETEVVAACSQGHEWQLALVLARARREPTLLTYNWLLFGLRAGASWQVGIALLADARRRRIPPNTISYRHLMFLLDGGPWQQTVQLLKCLCHETDAAADSETLASAVGTCENHHRLAECQDILLHSVFRALQLHQSCGHAVYESKTIHGMVKLHDAWINAGLPSVLEPAVCRHWIRPLHSSLHHQSATKVGKMRDAVLQNAHLLPSFAARSLSECNSLRGASRWTTTWWTDAQLALWPLLVANIAVKRVDAGAVCAWIGYQLAAPSESHSGVMTVEAKSSTGAGPELIEAACKTDEGPTSSCLCIYRSESAVWR